MPIYQLVLPAMGESVSEATVTQWLKKEGDTVVADEAVVEVATDKVDSEVASEYSGVIKEILHPVNAVVAVDAPLALIETDEEIPQQTTSETTAPMETLPEEIAIENSISETAESYMHQAQDLVAPVTQSSTDDARFYSPLVKNIAKQENISEKELATISGTGKDDRVTKRDILAYVQNRKAPQSQKPPLVKAPIATPRISRSIEDAIVPMTRMEQVISEHMTRSLQTSAHVQSFIEIDVTKLWKWREKAKQDFVKQHGVKLTFTPIFFSL